jgi:heme-degrading monooxygenase HmoA
MKTPYYAVIFTNLQTSETEGYAAMAQKMEDLAKQQLGYLGMEHARDQIGITISYWESLNDIANWKSNLEHLEAQSIGKDRWYEWYTTRICKVEREYSFQKDH